MIRRTSKKRWNRDHPIAVESGSSNLEFMKFAVNYNNHLTDLLTKNMDAGAPILDFGAGTGEFALRLIKKGFKVNVLEVEQTLARNLREIGLHTSTSLLEIPESSYMYIYSLNVLEHIENDVETLKSLSSKLMEDGKLILYLPAFQFLFSDMDRRVGHYRRYSRRSIRAALSNANYEIEKMYYSDFLGFFATILYKLTPRRNGEVSITIIRFYDTYVYPMNRVLDKIFARFCGKNLFIVAQNARK
jgi:SAM-dependent methyltransferase